MKIKDQYSLKCIHKIIAFLFTFSIFFGFKAYGQDWSTTNTNVSNNLNDLVFINDTLGIAVGNNGIIIQTIDGGKSWISRTSLTTNNLNAVFLLSDGNVIAVGSNGTISVSSNYGNTWGSASISSEDYLAIHFINKDTGFVAGTGGEIKKTTDGGSTPPSTLNTNTSETLFGLYFINDSTGFASGSNGTLIKTTDGGDNWSSISVPTIRNIYDIYFINDSIGFIVCQGGNSGIPFLPDPDPVILKTTDGGNNWTTLDSSITDVYYSIMFLNDTIGYISGNSGQILKTIDGGNNWNSLNTGVSNNIYNIVFSSMHNGFAAADNGQVLKTCPVAYFISDVSEVICQNITVSFFNESKSAHEFRWEINEDSVSSENNLHYTFMDTGRHSVKLIAFIDNCSDTFELSINVLPSPEAAMFFNNQCYGDTITFTNNTQIESGTVSYIWSFGDGDSSNAVSPHHFYNSFGSYDISLLAVSDQDCKDSVSEILELYPVPIADFIFDNECLGTNIQFTNTSTLSSGSMSFYWDLGDGNLSVNQNSSNLYSSPGIYNVTLIVTSDMGCSDTAQNMAEVYHLPEADFIVNDYCLGSEVEFINTSSILSNDSLYYEWDFGEGSAFSNDVHPVYIYTQSGFYSVTLKVLSDKGCEDIKSDQIEIFSLPVPDFDISDICLNEIALFINNSVSGTANNEYLWKFGDGNMSNDENPEHSYADTGKFEVMLKIIDDNNCSDSLTGSIEILNIPNTDFYADDVCLGETVKFINLTTDTGNAPVYEWHFGDGQTSFDYNPLHIYPDSGLYNVSLLVAKDNGCSKYIEKVVEVHINPNANFLSENVCFGKPVQFLNTSVIHSTNATFLWHFGDGNISTESEPVHNYSDPGTYNIKLIVESGCKDSIIKIVEIYDLPVIDFTYETYEKQVSFTPSDTTLVSYFWDFGDGNSSQNISPVHAFQAGGKYDVSLRVNDNRGCQNIIYKNIDISITSILNHENKYLLNLYPLPFKDEINFDLNFNENCQVKITVWDIYGRKLGTLLEKRQFEVGNYNFRKDASKIIYVQGAYFLKFEINNDIQFKSIYKK